MLAVEDVSGTYAKILAACRNRRGAKIVTANEDQSNPSNPSGQLDFVIVRGSQTAGVEKAISRSQGRYDFPKREARSADMNATTDEKVELAAGDRRPEPASATAQTTTMNVEASDPESRIEHPRRRRFWRAGAGSIEQHLQVKR